MMSDHHHAADAANEPSTSASGGSAISAPEQMGPPAPPSSSPVSASTADAASDRRWIAILVAALVVLLVMVGSAPFWAAALPWGAAHDDAALADRLNRVEAAQQQVQGLAPRLDRVEAAQRELSAKTQQLLQNQGTVATTIQPLDQRLTALENKPSVPPGALDDMRRQVSQTNSADAALSTRVDALDKALHAQAANSAADVAALLALAQIRDAIESGHPFVAAYEALARVSSGQTDMAQAAAPLAESARTGVATRAVLIERLRAEKDKIAAAPAAAASGGTWTDTALGRLRGLVTIRRTDKPASAEAASTPASAVNAADTALTAGDLQRAVNAISGLSGHAADEAAPWLHMAQQRLAVETSLHQLDTMLTAKLGKASPQGNSGSGG